MQDILDIIDKITLGGIKDILVSLAAIVGMCVSIKGLSLWRKQHVWKIEFDLARRILHALYEYKDWLMAARSPLILGSECQLELPEDASRDFHELKCIYEKRMESVAAARRALATHVLEAEALWGGVVRERFINLFQLENELASAVRRYLYARNPKNHLGSRSNQAVASVFREEHEAILWSKLDDENDVFEQRLEDAIEDMERTLQPKLKA